MFFHRVSKDLALGLMGLVILAHPYSCPSALATMRGPDTADDPAEEAQVDQAFQRAFRQFRSGCVNSAACMRSIRQDVGSALVLQRDLFRSYFGAGYGGDPHAASRGSEAAETGEAPFMDPSLIPRQLDFATGATGGSGRPGPGKR